MRVRTLALTALAAFLPRLVVAQANPVADAFRADARDEAKKLIASAETMPADKYSFKPTPAQMSFGEIVAHLAGGNDYFCGTLTGTKAPERTKVDPTAGKETLVARLKETFQFCDEALVKLDDSKLTEQLPFFGGKMVSRASMILITTADWADHYSQSAIYLRLNGHLPPTAKKPAP